MRASNPAHERWFDVLCSQVLSLAKGTAGDVVQRYAPVNDRPELGSATLVAQICSWTSRAMTTVQITDRLIASGCLGEQDRGNVTALVRRVRLRWASKGLPIADWWDVDQLLVTLLSHLAPRISAERGLSEAAKHVRDVFGITAQPDVDALITHPLQPPPLPDNLSDLKLAKEADFGALDLLADLASRPGVREYIEDVCSRSLLGGGAPVRPAGWELSDAGDVDAWLADAQVTTVEWKVLNELTQFIADGGHDELSHDLSSDVVSFEPEFLAGATLIVAEAWASAQRGWRK